MATPLGHALAGVALGAGLGLIPAWRPLPRPGWEVAIFALLAQAPDLDFLPGLLLGQPSLYHHGPSHSLGAAALFGLALAAWGWRRGPGQAWRWGLLGGLSYALHVVIDWATMDHKPPIGLPMYWPLSGDYLLAAQPLFLEVRRGPLSWDLLWHTLRTVGRESLLLGPPALALTWLLYRRRRRGA